MNFLAIILYAVAILFCDEPLAQHKKVVKVKIVSMEWSASTLVSQSPSMLVRSPAVFRRTVVERKFVDALGRFVDSLHVTVPTTSTDTRLVCLLYRSCGIVDTLSFGGIGDMRYNGGFYALDTNVAYLIASKIPPYHRGELMGYLRANRAYIEKQWGK